MWELSGRGSCNLSEGFSPKAENFGYQEGVMQFMKGVFRRRRRNFWGSKGGHAIYEVGFRAGGAKNRLNLGSELKSSMTPPSVSENRARRGGGHRV